MIFSNFERTDSSPKLNIESDFAFLNRTSRDEMARVRDLLEALLLEYPEQDDLVARFRSGNNPHFRSAEFELLLFSYLNKQGFKLTPHPVLDNGSASRPDFLVEAPNGDQFYLEAVLATEHTEDRTHDPLLATTLDVFSSTFHKNFTLIVQTSGYPSTQPSGKKLRNATIRWLDSLDPDEVQAQLDIGGHDALPRLVWSHEGLDVSVQALPLLPDRRGKASRLMSVQFGQAGWVDASGPIRDAIKFKGSKYGELGKPLVVAVNFTGHHLDRRDEMQALFGQEQMVFSVTNPSAEPKLERAPDGAWTGKGGPQFTRVSGAWIFDNMCMYNLPSREPTLYLHPWARHPLSAEILRYPHAIGIDGKMTWHQGIKPAAVLGLPETWP